jgi:hypothetical protein
MRRTQRLASHGLMPGRFTGWLWLSKRALGLARLAGKSSLVLRCFDP